MSSKDSVDDVVTFKPNTVIFCEGEPSTYMYIVKRGKIRIFKEHNDSLLPISLLRSQDFLGELSIFDDSPRSATAMAIEETEVVLIKKTEIRKMLKECPEWVTQILKTLCDRLRESVEILRQHHISDDIDEDPKNLTADKLSRFKDAILDYKKRRGIS